MTDTTGTSIPALPPEYAPADSGNKVGSVIGGAVLVLAIAAAVLISEGMRTWFAVHTGILNGGPDPNYNFWSGFGSDLGEATLIGAVSVGVYTGVRKVNCHTKGCWRIGHHALEGTPYILCRHHHPGVPTQGATHEHILAAHHKHLLSREAASSRR